MKRQIMGYLVYLGLGMLFLASITILSCTDEAKSKISGPYSFFAEIVPGVHLLAMLPEGTELAPSYLGICAYLIEGKNGRHVLIDSGLQSQRETLVRLLASQNIKPTDIEMVVCTHAHSDHAGGCAFFQQQGARIAIHKLAGESIDGTPPFRDPNAERSPSDSRKFEAFRPDIRFSDGDVLRAGGIELRVLHTPGHTPDSCSFVLKQSGKTVLFAGDLNGWYIIEWGSNQKHMLASVRKVRGIHTDYVCFGHRVVSDDLPRFWDKLEHAVEDGIFQLVDRHGYSAHIERTGKKVLESGPNQ